jgi:arylsulfatase A-like enzyme
LRLCGKLPILITIDQSDRAKSRFSIRFMDYNISTMNQPMKNPIILVIVSLLATALLHAEARPNLLVFIVDDMGVMDTSVPFLTDGKGQPQRHPLNNLYRTPAMENLAQHGMRFETFYANSVCSPSRISFMTGQSSARHHTTQWIRSEKDNRGEQGPKGWQWKGITQDQQTLPTVLKRAGYRNLYVGKAHFGPFKSHAEFPSNLGFDVNIGGCSYGQPGSYYGEDGFGWIKGDKSRAVPDLEAYHGKNIFLTEALTQEMNGAIKETVATGDPFFACMAYYAVHSPFMPNKRYAANYADAAISKDAKAYATMIEGMDASVGEILKQLDTLGVAENTLVLFLGDNGSDSPLGEAHDVASSAPLRGKKATHYEGGMRIPFIAAWAKPNPAHPAQRKLPIQAGAITTKMGRIYDIFPTLLAAAGVSFDGKIDGHNLAPLLNGGNLEGQRDFLMHFPHDQRSSYFTAYRLDDWKVVYHYTEPEAKRYELFNLANDPTESTNLSKSHPHELRRIVTAMATALEDANAQYPIAKGDPTTPLKPIIP